MIGEARRIILTALLQCLKGRVETPSDLGLLQDYHYDMAEQYYLGKISQVDYVLFLHAAKFEPLDNLQIMGLLSDLDNARERSSYRETGHSLESKLVQYYVVQDGMGKHIFSGQAEATSFALKHKIEPHRVEVWQSFRDLRV